MKVFEIQGGFGLDALQAAERPVPMPGPGQVRVAVKAVSLNYRDLMIARGQYNPNLKLPRIPCSDGVGVVEAVGPGVTRVQVGDRVASTFFQGWLDGPVSPEKTRLALGDPIDGVLAERVVLDQDGVLPVPAYLSDVEGATLPCAALTVWNALFEASTIRPGETVLTLGTGGVSLFALQFAHMAGARVIVTSSSDAKLQRVRELGAWQTINYRTDPEWDKAVRKLTDGVGVDHVIELGGAGTLDRSQGAVRSGGTISLIGVLATGPVSLFPILMKSIRVQGIFVGSRAMFAAMNRALTEHEIRPVVDRVFPFAESKAAFEHLASQSHFGKVAIRFD